MQVQSKVSQGTCTTLKELSAKVVPSASRHRPSGIAVAARGGRGGWADDKTIISRCTWCAVLQCALGSLVATSGSGGYVL
jgi:hypothetical protein